MLRGKALCAGLDRKRLFSTGEPRQIKQRGHLRIRLQGLRRQIHREAHWQADGLRLVPVKALLAAMTGVRRQ
jgi:hypothetical protein